MTGRLLLTRECGVPWRLPLVLPLVTRPYVELLCQTFALS